MQLRIIDTAQLAETIRDADFASHLDCPGGARVHILRFGGQDVLVIHHLSDSAVVVEADDDGLPSIHQEAARSLGDSRRAA